VETKRRNDFVTFLRLHRHDIGNGKADTPKGYSRLAFHGKLI